MSPSVGDSLWWTFNWSWRHTTKAETADELHHVLQPKWNLKSGMTRPNLTTADLMLLVSVFIELLQQLQFPCSEKSKAHFIKKFVTWICDYKNQEGQKSQKLGLKDKKAKLFLIKKVININELYLSSCPTSDFVSDPIKSSLYFNSLDFFWQLLPKMCRLNKGSSLLIQEKHKSSTKWT